ncbi:MAG TPA: SprT family zinc-dependent metalloprotease [Thermoleophilaceae bacterium]|nr:SprT family zinc-dependent metalloprotease [Thermoleophilaceae bacterium]
MTSVPYRIRRSDRALHARIQVGADGVEVVVPRRFPLRNVDSFVQEKRPWIERTLRRIRESEADFPPSRACHGAELPYLGERIYLEVGVKPSRKRAHVARRGSTLRVALGPDTPLEEALEAWYRRRARAEVAPRLDAAVARAGRSYSRLQIRGQRSRWASCSTSGTMSFNWRLLLAPPEILDYVVEHEVAHLDVQDHSARFWRLLASRCPDWREHERWLRAHGHALRLLPAEEAHGEE